MGSYHTKLTCETQHIQRFSRYVYLCLCRFFRNDPTVPQNVQGNDGKKNNLDVWWLMFVIPRSHRSVVSGEVREPRDAVVLRGDIQIASNLGWEALNAARMQQETFAAPKNAFLFASIVWGAYWDVDLLRECTYACRFSLYNFKTIFFCMAGGWQRISALTDDTTAGSITVFDIHRDWLGMSSSRLNFFRPWPYRGILFPIDICERLAFPKRTWKVGVGRLWIPWDVFMTGAIFFQGVSISSSSNCADFLEILQPAQIVNFFGLIQRCRRPFLADQGWRLFTTWTRSKRPSRTSTKANALQEDFGATEAIQCPWRRVGKGEKSTKKERWHGCQDLSILVWFLGSVGVCVYIGTSTCIQCVFL